MRKLVTLRKVSAVDPIKDADFIVAVTIDGWRCVAKKGEMAVGDKIIYFEIDSFLPAENPAFAFLSKDFREYNGAMGARLRTVRLKGVLSQGLALPVTSFPDIDFTQYNTGDDLTDILGVTKWEPPMPAQMAGEARGLFPSYIPKTDSERIQNFPDIFTEHGDKEWECSIKIDGSSHTCYYGGFEGDIHFGVCSRNYELKDNPNNTLWKMARKYKLDEVLPLLDHRYAIQSEIYGEGIQDNIEKIKGHALAVFNVYDITEGRYLLPMERVAFINHINSNYGCGLEMVPILETIILNDKFKTIQDILDYAEGPSLNKNTKREGVVFKHTESNLNFKAISNSFLLGNKNK